MTRPQVSFLLIVILTALSIFIAIPKSFSLFGKNVDRSPLRISLFGKSWIQDFSLKQGLDIQGGMQVVLEADMSEIEAQDREVALESAREVILRRVDLYGINEPVVQTSVRGDQYRIIVELAGVTDANEALRLLGTTAQLDFRLQKDEDLLGSQASASANLNEEEQATQSALTFIDSFEKTELNGKDLKRASVQFDPNTNEPLISLEFNEEGTQVFAEITRDNIGKVLAIFLDEVPITAPVIQSSIPTGQAQISGSFDLEEAKQLAIQLNAGALPVPIKVLEQRNIGASLGQESVSASLRAGVIGIGLVMVFMILYYGTKGFLASLALVVYSVITIALYKVLGVTLTLPGIAGLLLSIGMAVDANILIFERMKEELRLGKPFGRAMELGFGRAWDSIKDANLATIVTALVLINPMNFNFLNTSGLVRGFGVTLLVGVLVSLFTGVVVTRTLMRLFLKPAEIEGKS